MSDLEKFENTSPLLISVHRNKICKIRMNYTYEPLHTHSTIPFSFLIRNKYCEKILKNIENLYVQQKGKNLQYKEFHIAPNILSFFYDKENSARKKRISHKFSRIRLGVDEWAKKVYIYKKKIKIVQINYSFYVPSLPRTTLRRKNAHKKSLKPFIQNHLQGRKGKKVLSNLSSSNV